MVITTEQAVIPPATLTTPPTDGTVSVAASSASSGTSGNIRAQDINQACCGGAVFAQNLYAFSGGRDAQDITVVQASDIANASASLKTALDQDVSSQTQHLVQPGQQLLPLGCSTTTTADHHAGDPAASVTVSLSEHCVPLVYSLDALQQQAAAAIRHDVPQDASIVGVSVRLLTAVVSDAQNGIGTLTVVATAQVQQVQG